MENKEKGKKQFNLGDYYDGIRPPKSVGNTKWECVRRHPEKSYPEKWRLVSTEPFIPSIDELSPINVEGKLYNSREEALRENPPAQPTLPTIEPVRPKGEDETL